MNEALPVLYGAGYSVYVRAVLMALSAKGARFVHEPVDVFAEGGAPSSYLALSPFGKIPTLKHGDLVLYETIAINRYIDEAFEGPSLQPANVKSRARMMQLMSMTDSYGYWPLVWEVYVERISKPREGLTSDEAKIANGLSRARIFLGAVETNMVGGPWLLGSQTSLADFQLAPVIGYFIQAPEGADLLAEFQNLSAWWKTVESNAMWKAAIAASNE